MQILSELQGENFNIRQYVTDGLARSSIGFLNETKHDSEACAGVRQKAWHKKSELI
jgi:hypothetical protein